VPGDSLPCLAQDQSSGDQPIIANIAPDQTAKPDQILGDWGGLRSGLSDKGIDLSIGYKGETATNLSGGNRKAITYTAQLAFSGLFDLDRIAGMHGTSVQATVSYRHGDNLNTVAGIDMLQPIEEVYGRGQTWRLSEFYVQQRLAHDAVILRAGRMGAGDFNTFDCDFMNVSWCGSPAGNITSYWYNFPVGQWGAWAKLRGKLAFAQVGIYEDNRNNVLDNGFYLSVGGAKGVLVRAQAGLTPTFGAHALAGRYQAGFWHTSASDADVRDDALGHPFVQSGLAPRQVDGQNGFYIQAQQQITGSGSVDPITGAVQRKNGVNLFVNYTRGDPRTATLVEQVTGGLYLDAPFASRPRDHFGIAAARNHYNSRAAQSDVLAGIAPYPRKDEFVFETYYALSVRPGISIRPDLQYILSPGGFSRAGSVTVLGIRLDLTV
jgi:porin